MMERVRRAIIIICILVMHSACRADVHTLALRDLQKTLAVKNGDEFLIPLVIADNQFQVIWLAENFASIKVILENKHGDEIQNIRSRDFHLRRRLLLTHENCNPCRLHISVWTDSPEAEVATIQTQIKTFSTDNHPRLAAETQLQKIQLIIDAPESNQYGNLWWSINTLSAIWMSLDEKNELINSLYLQVHYTEGKQSDSISIVQHSCRPFVGEQQKTNLFNCQDKLFIEQYDQVFERLKNDKSDTLFAMLKRQRELSLQQMNIFELARINIDLGREEFSKGNYALARAYYNQSFSLVNVLPAGNHKTLYLLANIQHELGQLENKIENFDRADVALNNALLNFSTISDASSIAEVLNSRGFMYRQQNKLSKAALQHQIAFQLSRHGTDAVGLDMRTLYHIGAVNVLRGRYFAALESLQKAETIAKQLGVTLWHAHIVAAKARANLELDDLDEAKVLYAEALVLYTSVNAQADLPMVYANLGRLFVREGNIEKSLYYFEKAKLAEPNLTGPEYKLNLAQAEIMVLVAQGKYTEAYRAQTDLLAVGRQSANEFFQGRCLSQLADIAIHQQNYSVALPHALDAINLQRTKGDDLYFIKSNYLAALSSFMLDKPQAQIVAYLDDALAVIEIIRNSLLRDDLRREYFSLQRAIYDLKVRVYLNNQTPDSIRKALLVAESFKARTLYETFLQDAVKKSSFFFERLTTQQPLKMLLTADTLSDKAPVPVLMPFNETGLRSYQQQLHEKEAVLYYFLGEHGAYVWIIQHSNLSVHKINSGKEFASLLVDVLTDLNHPPRSGASASSLREEFQRRSRLSNILLAESAVELAAIDDLTIVPDGLLHQLPFAALLGPSTSVPLLNTHSLAYSLSLATDVWLRQSRASLNHSGAMLVVANSGQLANQKALPAVAKEIATIESLWTLEKARMATTLFDSNATKKNIADLELSHYEIMHFAGHAKVDWNSPEMTAILLQSETGDNPVPLTIGDIARWHLNAELVVLNACETAQGKLIDGEGSMGLSRAFFEAGAKRVIASFWPVEDSSSAYFMEQFYQSLLQHNKRPLYALQEAQRAVSRVPRWSHPYYWSSMAYYGKREAWRE